MLTGRFEEWRAKPSKHSRFGGGSLYSFIPVGWCKEACSFEGHLILSRMTLGNANGNEFAVTSNWRCASSLFDDTCTFSRWFLGST